MRRSFRFVLVTALASICASAGAEDLSGTLAKIKETGVITLGYRESSVPFSYLSSDGKPVGYAFEVCRRVADAAQKALDMPKLEVRLQAVTSATLRLFQLLTLS